jgi:flagellar basal-body rod modification protein FlgD
MPVSGISANDTSFTSALQGTNVDKNAFMQLLVSQMKNQDPLSPQDNTQFIAQLAQFSSLEQMQQLNDNIIGLAARCSRATR